ncbi:MAG TPA: hypothetical protein VNO75_00370 [Gemmatimonadaceae bacterium]|nr:hypothetical protein [Gemmatimonadaceae bacterium]
MPATTFKIYPKRQLVSIHWSGSPVIEQWYDVIERILAHPDYRRGMNLITHRTGGANTITPDFVRDVLLMLEGRAARMTPMSIAVLAPAAYDFGMARMMETLSESAAIVVRAFRRPREAMEWLKSPVRYHHSGEHLFAVSAAAM